MEAAMDYEAYIDAVHQRQDAEWKIGPARLEPLLIVFPPEPYGPPAPPGPIFATRTEAFAFAYACDQSEDEGHRFSVQPYRHGFVVVALPPASSEDNQP